MTPEELEIVKIEYQSGRANFERGTYRQSVQHLEKACALVARSSRLGGEVQIWLVTAYEAAGQRNDAIALCKQLYHHPDLETRKQSRRLLYILEAPRLNRSPDWLTQIPDLSRLSDQDDLSFYASNSPPKSSSKPQPSKFIPETVDLSQVNTRDNQFVWVALAAIGLILGGLLWFG